MLNTYDFPWLRGLTPLEYQAISDKILQNAVLLAQQVMEIADRFVPDRHSECVHSAFAYQWRGELKGTRKPRYWEGILIQMSDRVNAAFWNKERTEFHLRAWKVGPGVRGEAGIDLEALVYRDERDDTHILSMKKEDTITEEWAQRPSPKGPIPKTWKLQSIPNLMTDPFWIWNQLQVDMCLDDGKAKEGG